MAQHTNPSGPDLDRTRGRTASLTIQQSLRTRRPAEAVFAYVSDFNRAKEWRTEVRESTQSPPGPMITGSILREESRILFIRIVTESVVDELDPGRRFTFSHVAGPFPVGGEYRVDQLGDGTLFTYTLQVELRGPWRMAANYFRRSGAKTMARSLRALERRLETESTS